MGMVAFVGTGSALYWRQRRAFMARRRARRGKDGGRKEIVGMFDLRDGGNRRSEIGSG